MAKFCQTSLNSLSISRYYLRYFPCLTAIYLIFITIFKMRTRPSISNNEPKQSSAIMLVVAAQSMIILAERPTLDTQVGTYDHRHGSHKEYSNATLFVAEIGVLKRYCLDR